MDKKNHTHKLKLIKYKSGNRTFFCVLDCSYKINPSLALGKKVLCWRCGDEFSLTEYSMRLVKPHCPKCHKSKEVKEKLDILERGERILDMIEPLTLSERLQREIKQKEEDI